MQKRTLAEAHRSPQPCAHRWLPSQSNKDMQWSMAMLDMAQMV